MIQVDFDTPRTPCELRQYFLACINEINADEESRKQARLSPGKLIKELYPFSLYVTYAYPEDDVECRIIDGNQGYDGVVARDGTLIERVEVCRPIEGQKEHEYAKQLNEQGYSDPEAYNMEKRQNELIELIVRSAKGKSNKDYKGCTLLFSLSSWNAIMYFNRGTTEGITGIERLIAELKNITFIADKVFLLCDPYGNFEISITQIA